MKQQNTPTQQHRITITLISFLLITLALLLASACSKTAYVCPDGSTTPNPEECKEVRPIKQAPSGKGCVDLCGDGTCAEVVCAAEGCPCPETQQNCPQDCSPKEDPAVKEILERAKVRVTSYQYLLQSPPTNLTQDEYLVLGEKMRINLLNFVQLNKTDGYDTIFVDKTKKTATGLCLSTTRRICRTATTHELPYTTIYTKTPLDWLSEVKAATIKNRLIYQSTPSTIISYTTRDGRKAEMILSDYYGIPLKITIYSSSGEEEETYIFHGLSVNTVTEEDVTPP
ncbi:hypothetical protein D6783_00750 [Candidatus Woesearchaeota archaeon]|nr:MAG: hypothetical protein D6783_00750 [Candidatus Woesearchaeota archaeon]